MSHLLKPLSVVIGVYLLSALTIGFWLQLRDFPALAVLATVLVAVSTSSHALFLAWISGKSNEVTLAEDVEVANAEGLSGTGSYSSANASEDSQSLRSIISELVSMEDQYATDRQVLLCNVNGVESPDSGLQAVKITKQEL